MASAPDTNGLWLPDSGPFSVTLDASLAASVLHTLQPKRQIITLWSTQPFLFVWSDASIPPALPTINQAVNTWAGASAPANSLLQVEYRPGMQTNFGSGVITITGFRVVRLGGAGTCYINEWRRLT